MRTDESIERPLRGLRVIEFESIGPGLLTGHMLSELGARVTVVARPIGEAARCPLLAQRDIPVSSTNVRFWG